RWSPEPQTGRTSPAAATSARRRPRSSRRPPRRAAPRRPPRAGPRGPVRPANARRRRPTPPRRARAPPPPRPPTGRPPSDAPGVRSSPRTPPRRAPCTGGARGHAARAGRRLRDGPVGTPSAGAPAGSGRGRPRASRLSPSSARQEREDAPERRPGAVQRRLDRLLPLPRPRRDLRDRQLLDVLVEQRLPIVGRERGERRADQFTGLAPLEYGLRQLLRLDPHEDEVDLGVDLAEEVVQRDRALLPPVGAEVVAGDPAEPGGERRAPLVGGEVRVGGEERLLDDGLGHAAVAARAVVDELVQGVDVPLEERLRRLPVAPEDPRAQVEVVLVGGGGGGGVRVRSHVEMVAGWREILRRKSGFP